MHEDSLKKMYIRPFLEGDQPGVVSLWEQCGLTRPWNDPIKDVRRKLKVQPHMFLVGIIDGEIVGSIMAGYDGHRGWIQLLSRCPPATSLRIWQVTHTSR